MPRRWIDVLKSFSRKRSHDSPRMCRSCLWLSAKFSAVGGVLKPRLSQTNLAITFHITAFCHRYQFGLNEDRFNDILWWNCAKLLANIAIHRLFMRSLDKSWARGNIHCESSCWWLYYGDLKYFFHSSKRNILLRLWWTISQSDQQHTFTTATSAEKVHQSTTRRLVFRVPCLSHYRRYLQSWVVCLSRFPRLFAHSVI